MLLRQFLRPAVAASALGSSASRAPRCVAVLPFQRGAAAAARWQSGGRAAEPLPLPRRTITMTGREAAAAVPVLDRLLHCQSDMTVVLSTAAASAAVAAAAAKPKSWEEAWVEVRIPLEGELRDKYVSPHNDARVRIGRLLELLDAFTGDIAFRHADAQ